MNYLLGERTENEAVCKLNIEMSALEQYLNEKNKDCEDKRFKYNENNNSYNWSFIYVYITVKKSEKQEVMFPIIILKSLEVL